MKYFYYPAGFIALFVLLTLSGCAKKYGCEDKYALNYDEVAKRDDGSCFYLSTTHFNWSKYNVNDLIADGHVYLSIYVNEVLIGSDSTKNHQDDFSFQSDDEFPGITYVDTIFGESQHYLLKCVDQDGYVMLNFVVSFEPRTSSYTLPI